MLKQLICPNTNNKDDDTELNHRDPDPEFSIICNNGFLYLVQTLASRLNPVTFVQNIPESSHRWNCATISMVAPKKFSHSQQVNQGPLSVRYCLSHTIIIILDGENKTNCSKE